MLSSQHHQARHDPPSCRLLQHLYVLTGDEHGTSTAFLMAFTLRSTKVLYNAKQGYENPADVMTSRASPAAE